MKTKSEGQQRVSVAAYTAQSVTVMSLFGVGLCDKLLDTYSTICMTV